MKTEKVLLFSEREREFDLTWLDTGENSNMKIHLFIRSKKIVTHNHHLLGSQTLNTNYFF